MLPFHISPIAMAVFLACGFILLGLLMQGAGNRAAEPPSKPNPIAKPFLTPREEAMLIAMERVLPDHRIHAQVAMGALLRAPLQPGRRSHPADRNRFSQKIVDFVIQHRDSGAVIALVEIEDHLHVTRRDQARDAMTGGAGYSRDRESVRRFWETASVDGRTVDDGLVEPLRPIRHRLVEKGWLAPVVLLEEVRTWPWDSPAPPGWRDPNPSNDADESEL